jgi:hypothetical protein
MSPIKKVLIAVSIAVLVAVFTPSVKAFEMADDNWRTSVTFEEYCQVGDLTLTPGSYVFSLVPGLVSRNVIRIYSVDNRRYVGMVQGINDYRIDTYKKTGFTFTADANGMPRALEYWFYPGWNRGVKIVYSRSHFSGSLSASNTLAAK